MTDGRVERRLAAILAADVEGYSRLMGADEVGTLEALKAHRREVVDPAIAANRGRIVKTTGDGIAARVRQRRRCRVLALMGITGIRWPSETEVVRMIVFRIGINVGDIIIDDDDILAMA